jgi:hypothetical protein
MIAAHNGEMRAIWQAPPRPGNSAKKRRRRVGHRGGYANFMRRGGGKSE